jgi:hypothetical protein
MQISAKLMLSASFCDTVISLSLSLSPPRNLVTFEGHITMVYNPSTSKPWGNQRPHQNSLMVKLLSVAMVKNQN